MLWSHPAVSSHYCHSWDELLWYFLQKRIGQQIMLIHSLLLISYEVATKRKHLLFNCSSPVSVSASRAFAGIWWYKKALLCLSKKAPSSSRGGAQLREPTDWTAAWLDWLPADLISVVSLILETGDKCSCLRVFWRAEQGERGPHCSQKVKWISLILWRELTNIKYNIALMTCSRERFSSFPLSSTDNPDAKKGWTKF